MKHTEVYDIFKHEVVAFESHLYQRRQVCMCKISLKAAILLSVANELDFYIECKCSFNELPSSYAQDRIYESKKWLDKELFSINVHEHHQ